MDFGWMGPGFKEEITEATETILGRCPRESDTRRKLACMELDWGRVRWKRWGKLAALVSSNCTRPLVSA